MSMIHKIVGKYGGWVSSDGGSGSIPAPGHSKQDRSVSLRLNAEGKVLIHCFSDTDWRDVRAQLIHDRIAMANDFIGSVSGRRMGLVRGRRAYSADRVPPSFAHAKKSWDTRRAIAGTLAERYLRNRGLSSLSGNTVLGASNAMAMSGYKKARHAPCLLAKITDENGRFRGVQATFLFLFRQGFSKRRLIYGQQKGFAVHLSEPDDELLIGEGLETTASAARRFNIPAWALLNTYNLSSFRAPRDVRRLIIAGDNDLPGLKAAKACRDHHRRLGIDCTIRTPDRPGADWNDFDHRTD